MKLQAIIAGVVTAAALIPIQAYSITSHLPRSGSKATATAATSSLFRRSPQHIVAGYDQSSGKSTSSSALSGVAAAVSTVDPGDSNDESISIAEKRKQEKAKRVRELGGLFAFPTKYGALNPFAIFYGSTAIFLGIFWYISLQLCRFMYVVTGCKVDTFRKIPVMLSQCWGETLMRLTFSTPEYENRQILKDFYKTGRAAMFVANHNSWQDIPYLGSTIGWRNYKIVAKKELDKVPILSAAINVGGNVVVDRTDRRSQLMTLKKGIKLLQDGVHLCTFPEGTRSRTGRINEFKNGAFKMAHKAGAPVVPLSIVGATTIHPIDFMFPIKSTIGKKAKVIVHEPIESEGKTEAELADAVREAIISGLPEDQRPL